MSSLAACLSAQAQSAVQTTKNTAQATVYQLVSFKLSSACNPALPPLSQPGIEAHKAYVSRLTQKGTLVVEGPFLEAQTACGGFYLLAVSIPEEARRIALADPALTSHLLELEQIMSCALFASSWKPVQSAPKTKRE